MGKRSSNDAGRRLRESLATLDRDCERLVTSMQTPESKLGAKLLFSAAPEELGRAAVIAARRQAKRRR